MATVAGYGGAVKIGANTVAEIDEWTLDIMADELDVTKFGDTWKGFIPGLKSWACKFKGRWDQTDTNGQAALQSALLGGTSVAIKLFVNATSNYNGTLFVKAEHPKATVQGTVDCDFDGQGSGTLVYTP